ncbi:hypothetical protein [Helicobacter ailurogastricus]|uniref:Uncharacterized protein n=1 Tax=Helicobacter ailurogastricus TaxID=1578720 RepID=A0A0K2XAR3_9HELI|nr:hypothetical protein [Helicobacter ailurogastricus]CRF41702.1 hypothetical protein HAL011_15100 [Helicobacter ailurogastricus]CRF42852.1 hypothetical protein HAL013_10620 [Helicobacter ailurogastricus]CRF44420.1 hypothetical protein HAL09_10020 [Helicobacter ailurogastricus]
MPLPPKAYKLKCPCGFSKIIAPKSDALSPVDLMAMSSTCPQCGQQMQRVSLNLFDQIFKVFKK